MIRQWNSIKDENYDAVINPKPITVTKTKPKSTYKKKLVKEKTGPKTDKVIHAFEKIPLVPQDVEQYSKTTGVSVGVLRQAKRFDKTGLPGKVRVKKLRSNVESKEKRLMIWRELS